MNVDCTGAVVSITPETQAAYRTRAHNLSLMAKREGAAVKGVAGMIEWFAAQHHRWAPASIRQYRAAVLYGVETTMTDALGETMLAKTLRAGPAPKMTGPKQTSSRKRRSLKVEEFTRLGDFLQKTGRADDMLILGFVVFGAALFLSPIEYLDARVDGSMLIVRNAKATNGRGNGAQRERTLAGRETKTIRALKLFLRRLREALGPAGDRGCMFSEDLFRIKCCDCT